MVEPPRTKVMRPVCMGGLRSGNKAKAGGKRRDLARGVRKSHHGTPAVENAEIITAIGAEVEESWLSLGN